MANWSDARKAQGARTLAGNRRDGKAAEGRNESALKYMTRMTYASQKGAPGTVLDFVIYDEKGAAKVIQEVKNGAIRGTKGMAQIARQLGAATKAGAKYVIVYPGGKDGFFKAKNVSNRVKAMVQRGMDRGTAIIKNADHLKNVKPLIEKLGTKVKTLLPHTDQTKPDGKVDASPESKVDGKTLGKPNAGTDPKSDKTPTKIDRAGPKTDGGGKVDAAPKSRVGGKVAGKPPSAIDSNVDAKPGKNSAKVNAGPKQAAGDKLDRGVSRGVKSASPTPGPRPQGHVGAGRAKPGSAAPAVNPKAPIAPKGPAPSAAPAKVAPVAPPASPASSSAFKISPTNRF